MIKNNKKKQHNHDFLLQNIIKFLRFFFTAYYFCIFEYGVRKGEEGEVEGEEEVGDGKGKAVFDNVE